MYNAQIGWLLDRWELVSSASIIFSLKMHVRVREFDFLMDKMIDDQCYSGLAAQLLKGAPVAFSQWSSKGAAFVGRTN